MISETCRNCGQAIIFSNFNGWVHNRKTKAPYKMCYPLSRSIRKMSMSAEPFSKNEIVIKILKDL